jgi:Spy/CpxP family protein refolding chaperone
MRQRVSDLVGSKLDLDEAQKQRLGVLFDKMAEQRKVVMGADADPRARLRALMAGNTFDRAAAQQLVEQKTGAVRTAAPELITAFGDFYDGLKPEQQQKLREWMDKRGGRRWFGGQGTPMG